MTQIKATNLQKVYHVEKLTYPVLKGIDLSVKQGEFVSICGPSGSGKTTLLYTLSGLEPYTGGSVVLFDKELNLYTDSEKAKMRSHDIGFVFQMFNLIPNLTVYENILLSSVLGTQKSKSEILDVLDLVGIKENNDYYPYQLSGGMQQRVAIARALINHPKIIFADEPIGSLDYKNGLSIMQLFKKLNQELNVTIIMVTHNEDTTKYGTRTLHMLDGKVIKDENSN
ncbi:ABC transporter ATP-binding protein [Peloplasma aerotolerans]|uniref:ABC transporter ATP-binding protein n=1 Tax=Peloplasma aerotolerans TaxID=3044389 RepID=A0AAW6U6L6_9MOLU|nr:ABC transporter ATP-binding protein [Mariniplasma sp. M4Ah]MDI6452172.1 ABC transporter ATP-binding protein [Mariniplasma sp. M4Ah]